MSTPNPTRIIAEHWYMFVPVAGVTNIECDCGKFRTAGPYSIDEMRELHAEHVVSKLTDAGYSIVPSARVIHNEDEFHELPVRTWLRDSDGWVCQIGDDAESDPEWMAYPATVIWTPAAAAEGEKP